MARREDGTYDNTENILGCIARYDDTLDKKYLWECYDDLFHAVKSLMMKRLHYHPTEDLDMNCEMVVEKWLLDIVKRKSKGKDITGMKSPISYAHFMILRYWPRDDTIMNTAVSIEYENIDIGSNYEKDYDYDPYGQIPCDVEVIA